jgi:hypothetical protein
MEMVGLYEIEIEIETVCVFGEEDATDVRFAWLRQCYESRNWVSESQVGRGFPLRTWEMI